MNDAELVERARLGDEDAFGTLVDRHRAAVYRATLAALRKPAEAEDAAQEAFVSAWQRLASFRGESSFKTWLLAIAWRQALDRRRGLLARLRRLVPGEAVERLPTPTPEPGPELQLLDQERSALVRRLIEALPAKLRDPLLLAAAGEHSYEEIAGMLGTPVGTVKFRVFEARRRMKQRLARGGYGDE